ncbi:hypothetical protein SDJN03_20668, partial [Cucurbita argyrosperma subsp. sororia]
MRSGVFSDLLRDSISICDFNRTIHPQPRSVFLCDPITFARPLGSYFRSQVRSPVALQFPSTLSRGSYNWNQVDERYFHGPSKAHRLKV